MISLQYFIFPNREAVAGNAGKNVIAESSLLLYDDCSAEPAPPDTMSDEMLAQMLQLQFDQEYDRDLGKVEAKFNGSSKGVVLLLLPNLQNVKQIILFYLCSCCFFVQLSQNTQREHFG